MIRIACMEITVMDRLYYVEALPATGGKYVAQNYREVGGGGGCRCQTGGAGRFYWSRGG